MFFNKSTVQIQKIKYFRTDGIDLFPNGVYYYNGFVLHGAFKNKQSFEHKLLDNHCGIFVFSTDVKFIASSESIKIILNGYNYFIGKCFYGQYKIGDLLYNNTSLTIEVANMSVVTLKQISTDIFQHINNKAFLFKDFGTNNIYKISKD